ncbi:hypothetical protein V3C99_005942 [Haemonchus contortus]
MKYLLLALCVSLSTSKPPSEAEVLAALRAQQVPPEARSLSGEALVKYVNEKQNLFKAELKPTNKYLRYKVMDMKFVQQNMKPVIEDENDPGDDIPESFDARTHWPNCSSISHIPDQANCGSCWAVSVAGAISDRICIATKGRVQVKISATDILSCCPLSFGCEGGYPFAAWNHFATKGAVTGGYYGTKKSCRPYELHPCGRHGNDTYYGECKEKQAPTPRCKRRCRPGYKKSYTMDKIYGKNYYDIPVNVKAIQRDIMKYGPVAASFLVFDDFYEYTSGIYQNVAGGPGGGHAVKIIGWGKEKNIPYWIITNSWHEDWGEKGFFRMLRGNNECGIEGAVVGGHIGDI